MTRSKVEGGREFERASRRSQRGSRLLGVAAVAVSLALSAEGAQREVNRTRSIYVPVRFVPCPHVRNLRLSVAGDSTVFAPGLQVFQFAYYSERRAILPAAVDVRINAEVVGGGRAVDTNVIIRANGIVTAGRIREFDLEKLEKQLAVRRDARLEPVNVLITATRDCESPRFPVLAEEGDLGTALRPARD
jgi:hypothetical protein